MSARSASTNQGNNDNNAVEIDLVEVAKAVWKRKGFVIFFALLGAAIAFGITFFLIQPTYRSSFTAYVNNHSTSSEGNIDSLNNGDTTASQALAQTYAAIMVSRPVVVDALKEADLSYTYDEVSKSITTSLATDTQLVTLNVTLPSASDAYKLADAIAEVAPDYISDIVDGSSMKIVSDPVLPTVQYSPSNKKNTAVGAVIGLFLGMLIVIIQDLRDDRIRSAEDLEKKLGVPIIGVIPDFSSVSRDKYGYGSYYGSYGGQGASSNRSNKKSRK